MIWKLGVGSMMLMSCLNVFGADSTTTGLQRMAMQIKAPIDVLEIQQNNLTPFQNFLPRFGKNVILRNPLKTYLVSFNVEVTPGQRLLDKYRAEGTILKNLFKGGSNQSKDNARVITQNCASGSPPTSFTCKVNLEVLQPANGEEMVFSFGDSSESIEINLTKDQAVKVPIVRRAYNALFISQAALQSAIVKKLFTEQPTLKDLLKAIHVYSDLRPIFSVDDRTVQLIFAKGTQTCTVSYIVYFEGAEDLVKQVTLGGAETKCDSILNSNLLFNRK